MPVVNLSVNRLNKFLPGIAVDKILQVLPYVGLDIEGKDSEILRIRVQSK